MNLEFTFLKKTGGVFSHEYYRDRDNCTNLSRGDLEEYYQLLREIDQRIQENDRNTQSLQMLRNLLNQILETDMPAYNETTHIEEQSKKGYAKIKNSKKTICQNFYNSIIFILLSIKKHTNTLRNATVHINETLPLERNEDLETAMDRYCATTFPPISNEIVLHYARLKEYIYKDIENLTNGTSNDKVVKKNMKLKHQQLSHEQDEFIRTLYFNQNHLRFTLLEFIRRLTNLHRGNVIQQPVVGIAYEIHNYFDSLDRENIESIMNTYIRKHEINKIIADNITIAIDELENKEIFEPLLVFIEHSNKFKPEEKEILKTRINKLKDRIIKTGTFEKNSELLLNTIKFVSRTDDDFIEQYITIFIEDCFNAYARRIGQSEESSLSCSKGISERIISSVGAIIQNLCLIEDEKILAKKCPSEFNKLDKLFNRKLNDVIQEWAELYLEDGKHYEELKKLKDSGNKDAVKNHLIQFINKSYNNIISENLQMKIEQEIAEYERIGVFDNLYFGGKRSARKQTSKRRTRKNKTQKRKQRKQ